MENELITPIRLWKDYNPVKEPLETTYSSLYRVGEFSAQDCCFTVEKSGKQRMRAKITLIYPQMADARPAVICLNRYQKKADNELALLAAKAGFVGISLHYNGMDSYFPPEKAFADAGKETLNVQSSRPSPEKTAWFEWAKIARRAITQAAKNRRCDGRFALFGENEAAGVVWQAGAMDGRVGAIVTAGGFGFRQRSEIDDVFTAALSSESYLKFTNKPVLLLCPTNSPLSSFDRLESALALLPDEKSCSLIFSAGYRRQIEKRTMRACFKWLSGIFDEQSYPSAPLLQYKQTAEGIELFADCEQKAVSVETYYGIGAESGLRYWRKIETEEAKVTLPLFTDAYIYVYMNFVYADGAVVSTRPLHIKPECEEKPKLKKERVFCEKEKAAQIFLPESKQLIAPEEWIRLEQGGMDITGFTSDYPLISYRIGDFRYRGGEGNILQFEAYAKSSSVLNLKICAEGGEYYLAVKMAEAGEWQRITFAPSDFKNADFMPLKSWDIAKTLEFTDLKNVLIGNMLWV